MSYIQEIYKILPCFYAKETTSNIYRFLNSFADSLETFKANLDYAKLQLYVDTASGDSLDKLGALYNLLRMPGENDDNYRTRIRSFIPGFMGGGTYGSLITNVKNRWGWDIIVEDINSPPYLPKIKIKILLNENFPGNFEYITNDEFNAYIATIKAAGVGFYSLFFTSGSESLYLSEPEEPIIVESPYIECFYDCESDICVYDGNCMYGYKILYDSGFKYNDGWTYGWVP